MEIVLHVRLRNLEAEHDVTVGSSIECRVELVGRQLRAIDVFVEEPVHFLVPLQVHLARHVLLHHCLEVFGGRGFAGVGLYEILHHVLEALVAGSVVMHHHPDHVQDVGALGIDEAARQFETGSRIAHAVSHGDRPGIDSPETFRVALQQQFALIIPESDELLLGFSQ